MRIQPRPACLLLIIRVRVPSPQKARAPSRRAVKTGTTIGAPCNRVGVRCSAVVEPETTFRRDHCTSPCLSKKLRQLVTSPCYTLDRAGRVYHRRGRFSFDHKGQEVGQVHKMEGGESGNNQDTAAVAEPAPAVPEAPVKKKGVFKGKQAKRKFTRNARTGAEKRIEPRLRQPRQEQQQHGRQGRHRHLHQLGQRHTGVVPGKHQQ